MKIRNYVTIKVMAALKCGLFRAKFYSDSLKVQSDSRKIKIRYYTTICKEINISSNVQV